MRVLVVLLVSMTLLAGNAMADNEKTLYGFVEKAVLVDKDIKVSAKLDTGAKSASLSAIHINEVIIDGVSYLKFTVPTKKGPVDFQSPFVGRVKIKVRSGERQARLAKTQPIKRPVVIVNVKLGDKVRSIKVNLTNRKRFLYPLLLGRDAIIDFNGIVDPAATFIATSRASLNNEKQ